MNSWARISAGFASRFRAYLTLTVFRQAYERALAELPRIKGTALVVGSAPEPHRPDGLSSDWFVISINASQVTAADFGIPKPDLTFVRDGIDKPGEHQEAIWRVLNGRSTKHLVASMGSRDDEGVGDLIAAKNYHADRLTKFNRHVRGAVIAEMSGHYHVYLGGPRGISNGIFGALLALKLGADRVIMSGFSTVTGWYFAKEATGYRGHVPLDLEVCRAMVARGYPVFVTDPPFAESSGLPLWTSEMADAASH
jgi:hypothetical protein